MSKKERDKQLELWLEANAKLIDNGKYSEFWSIPDSKRAEWEDLLARSVEEAI